MNTRRWCMMMFVGFALLLLFGLASLVRGEDPEPTYYGIVTIAVVLPEDADEPIIEQAIREIIASRPEGVAVVLQQWAPASKGHARKIEAGFRKKAPQMYPSDKPWSEGARTSSARMLVTSKQAPHVLQAIQRAFLPVLHHIRVETGYIHLTIALKPV